MTREKDGEDLMLRASAFQMTRSIANCRYKIKTDRAVGTNPAGNLSIADVWRISVREYDVRMAAHEI
jgi:hypothetical protein